MIPSFAIASVLRSTIVPNPNLLPLSLCKVLRPLQSVLKAAGIHFYHPRFVLDLLIKGVLRVN